MPITKGKYVNPGSPVAVRGGISARGCCSRERPRKQARVPKRGLRRNKRSAKLIVLGLTSMENWLEVLLKRRIVRIGVTVYAVAAVLAVAVMPAPHLHQSASGKPLVHSHLINDPVEHAGTLDHGDHRGVRTFAPVFMAERTMNSVPALMAVAVLVLARPESRSLGYSDSLNAPVIHGPPGRVLSLRAPPA